jgi:sortase A
MLRIGRLESNTRAALDQMLVNRHPAPLAPPLIIDNGLIGRLSIPRIHLSAVVVEGDDERVLSFAVGHVPDTSKPWEAGNSAIAAHRDGIFRPLKDIQVGDDIELGTPQGDFVYRVRRTFVVKPTDIWVLDKMPQVELTLITCFPFSYIGSAPSRFIVQAEKIDSPSAQ